ncbi:nuclear transport factor 2 family protein, partial [Sphaerisporangium krabiense]
EVFERHAARISAGEWESLADLYAEDVVIEVPLAIPAPTRIEGKKEITRHLADRVGQVRLQILEHVVHETADPEVVIAEFTHRGEILATGRTWTSKNVQVLRVRDGLIVASRDYHDHYRINEAFGGPPEALDG